jgi:hypothetical protein
MIQRLIFTILTLLFTQFSFGQDLIITEIMADPTPTHGLPEKEYLELYNRSDKAINLNRIRLQIGTSVQTFGNFTIQPKEYIILCEKADEVTFSKYGKVLVINAFTLNNTGSTVLLKNERNQTTFSINYTNKMYDPKLNGGYSLEMIDTNFPCVEEANWTSSTNTQGGTPAKENAAKANKADLTSPSLLRYEVPNSTTVRLIFSEKLDSASAINKSNYTIDKGLIINQLSIESPANRNINLNFNQAIQDNLIYQLKVRGITDCSGNMMTESTALIGNVKPADSSDIVLNEILFDPLPDGEDYVEIYNRSNKLVSLKDWSLANIDNDGKLASIRKISADNFIIQPKQFLVLTRSPQTVHNQYFKAVKTNFLSMSSLPSFPDDSGEVILLNDKQKVFDRFDYDAKMHHPIIDDKRGVSLEKRDVEKPSNNAQNWHSAASSEGYGTPGYANSQGVLSTEIDESFSIEPQIFTPDGDGQNESVKVKYQFEDVGNVLNISIFDVSGRPVRKLTQSYLAGTSGNIEWDGKGDSMQILPVGYYILLIDSFNPNGNRKTAKLKVVLGGVY